MKRGNALIIAIVLLLAVSIFSTGNFIPFANNLSGGAYSTVGNAIVAITGNQVAEGEDSPRILAEHCTENRDCLSNICRTTGNNRQCIDTLPAEGEAKRGTGRTCSKDSHCTSGKCSNSICGLPRGNSCTIRNKRYCLSNDCFSGECDYSNPTNTPGNNAGDLCSKSNDDCISSPIIYSCVNHRCRKHSDLKSKGAACTEDRQCLSGDCTTQNKCATSSSDEACKQNSDCATNYVCSQKKCLSKIITPGIVTTGPKKSNGVSCTSDNQCSSSFCDPATNKCAPLVAVGGEDTRNAKLNRLKKAIESALNMLKARLTIIEQNHQNQVTGAVETGITTPNIVTTSKKANGLACSKSSECTSNFCSSTTNKCQPAPLVRAAGSTAKKANGEICTANSECQSNKCASTLGHILSGTKECVPSTAAESLPDAGPRTLSEWKTALTSLSASMQEAEDRVCKESFNHPEIETEGLPCSLSTPAAPGLPKAISPIKKVNIPFAIPRESEFQ